MIRHVLLLLALAACGDNLAPPVTAEVACATEIEHLCGVTKECGGDVALCTRSHAHVCERVSGPDVSADELSACVDAIEMHGCALHVPTFDTDATMCLGRWGIA